MKLILASTSPRRIELLKNAGLDFVAWSPDADETPIRGESPRALVKRLCREKAQSVLARAKSKWRDQAVILAADTIVVAPRGRNFLGSRILGKPKNRKEALSMIRLISGANHAVLTGYCLFSAHSNTIPLVRVVSTRVKIRKLSEREMKAYVDHGESMDKAGAYAAQGRGMTLIEAIQGSYTNVVGLPISHVLIDLERLI